MLSMEQYFEFRYKIFELQEEGIDIGCLGDIAYCVGLDFEHWDEDAEMEYIYKMVNDEEEFVEEMMFRYNETCGAEERKRRRCRELTRNKLGEWFS